MRGPAITYEAVAAELRPLGIKIAVAPGDYILSYRGIKNGPEERAESLADALALGRKMAERAPQPAPPPMGPTGRRQTRRGLMVKHNQWVSARRRAQAARGAMNAGKGRRS